MSNKDDAGVRVLERPPDNDPPATPMRQGHRRKADVQGRKRVRAAFMRIIEVLSIAGGLLVTIMLSAAIAFAMAVRSNEVAVPDLSGTSIGGATELLRLQELQLLLQGNRFDDSVRPDFIAIQTPSAGTTLKKGRSVRVWVSLGPRKRTVPRIEGETLQSAQLILQQGGFSVGRVVETHSNVYAPDTVVAQSPQAYEEVDDESAVSVLLSRGYLDEAYVMPDFIGRDYVELLDPLTRSALRVSQVQLVDYPGVPKNVVVRQSPSPGTKVFKRDRIILYLSKGS